MIRTAESIRSAAAGDRAAIRACLEASGLDAADAGEQGPEFLVAELEGAVIGTIGLERYGESGLLRSAAVLPGYRSAGTGRRLVEALEARAAASGIRELYLLTTTAAEFFARSGYSPVDRGEVRGAVLGSGQFRGACPSTAVVMLKKLAGSPSGGSDPSGTARAGR